MAVELADILTVEEDLELLDYKYQYDDFLMWPLVRHIIIGSVMSHMNGLDLPPYPKIKRDRYLNYLTTAIKRSPFLIRRQYDQVYINSGITNVFNGESYFNRIT